jgi:hypothetical protein
MWKRITRSLTCLQNVKRALLFVEALLVLLVDESVRHATPSDCHYSTNTQHNADLVERRVEDKLEKRQASIEG